MFLVSWPRCRRALRARLDWRWMIIICIIMFIFLWRLHYPTTMSTRRRVAVVHGNGFLNNYLSHVIRVFSLVGYEVQHGYRRSSSNLLTDEHWDVLWTHSYPFGSMPELKNIRQHQKVNKVPGMGYITNKVDLAKLNSSHIPIAFRLPSEAEAFRRFSHDNPNKLWVTKSNQHRGIKIKSTQEIGRNNNNNHHHHQYFVQEFIDRPLLIDNRKFDIGVYVVVTSVDPLRVYSFGRDALFRFCSRGYEPFDAKDTEKYVVGDDYTPVWEMLSFNSSSSNFKDGFNSYVDGRFGSDVTSGLWRQIDDVIADVFQRNRRNLVQAQNGFRFKTNFFEMVRFDFIIEHRHAGDNGNNYNITTNNNIDKNDKLWAYLMEVNMSPNLSSGHFPPNRRLYEQVLYNLFSLTQINFAEYSLANDNNNKGMVAHRADLVVHHAVCSKCVQDHSPLGEGKNICRCNSTLDDENYDHIHNKNNNNHHHNNSNKQRHDDIQYLIMLCTTCLSPEVEEMLRKTYLERLNSREMKAVHPSSQIKRGSDESQMDKLLRAWLKHKEWL